MKMRTVVLAALAAFGCAVSPAVTKRSPAVTSPSPAVAEDGAASSSGGVGPRAVVSGIVEFAIHLDLEGLELPDQVSAGSSVISFVNRAAVEWELVLSREGDELLRRKLAAGETSEERIELPAGRYELVAISAAARHSAVLRVE
jgi:hypothetical protein